MREDYTGRSRISLVPESRDSSNQLLTALPLWRHKSKQVSRPFIKSVPGNIIPDAHFPVSETDLFETRIQTQFTMRACRHPFSGNTTARQRGRHQSSNTGCLYVISQLRGKKLPTGGKPHVRLTVTGARGYLDWRVSCEASDGHGGCRSASLSNPGQRHFEMMVGLVAHHRQDTKIV